MNSNAKLNYDKYGWRPASVTYYEYSNIGCHVFCSKFAEKKNSVKIAETSSFEAKTCTSGGTRGPRIRVYLVFYANVEL